jgi:hypothetical protein
MPACQARRVRSSAREKDVVAGPQADVSDDSTYRFARIVRDPDEASRAPCAVPGNAIQTRDCEIGKGPCISPSIVTVNVLAPFGARSLWIEAENADGT